MHGRSKSCLVEIKAILWRMISCRCHADSLEVLKSTLEEQLQENEQLRAELNLKRSECEESFQQCYAGC